MKRLRIAYIIPDFDETGYAGGLYTVFQHCNGLSALGHDVTAFNNVGRKSRYLKLDSNLVRHGNDPRVVESIRPDIVVVSQWRNFYLMMRLNDVVQNGTKLVYSVQGVARDLCPPAQIPLVTKTYVGRYKDSVPVHKMVNCRYLQDYLMDGFGEASRYIKSGFEYQDVEPLLPEADKVRITARYDTSRYRGWKSVDAALERAARERGDIEIRLFEMKPMPQRPYRSVYHRGLHGKGLLGLFKSCDIFLGGTMQEAFSRPTLEAMSQGCAVCTLHPDGKGEFCIDGETALLARPGDDDTLYTNLIRLIDDASLRRRLSENGIRKAREFTWERCIGELSSFYLDLASKKYTALPTATAPIYAKDSGRFDRTLAVYDRDIFRSYETRLEWDEVSSCLESVSGSSDILLLVNKRPLAHVKPHIEASAPRKSGLRHLFRCFYSKKLRLRLYLLDKALFYGEALLRILSGRYGDVVFTGPDAGLLRHAAACRGVRVHFLGFDDASLKGYDFGSYTKEFLEKEKEFTARLRGRIKKGLGLP